MSRLMRELAKIITTVGSSLFTNLVSEQKRMRDEYELLKDMLYCSNHCRKYKDEIDGCRNWLREYVKKNKDASAELSSIRKIAAEMLDK
ncbi:hypothetical protein ACPVTF_08295 [Geobacillus icigianus]